MSNFTEKVRKVFARTGFGNENDTEILDNILPVISFEDGLMIFRNGTIGKGYEIEGVEMEKWEEGHYLQYNSFFQNAISFLPKNSIVQKIDVYFEDRKPTPEMPEGFFEQRYLKHYMDRPFYNHKSYLFVTSPATEKRYDETNNMLVQYKKIKLEESLKNIEAGKEQWKSVTGEFESQLKGNNEVRYRVMTDVQNQDLYRSMLNMEFRYENPDTFKAISNNENYLVIGDTKVNVLSMVGQASEIEPTRISSNGVEAPFTYNIGIMYQAPHIVSRSYKILDTEEMLKKLDTSVNINASSPFGDLGAIKAQQIKELTTMIRQEQGTLLEFSMSVAVMAKGEKRRTESIIDARTEILSWEGSEIVLESFNNMMQFFSMLPGNGSQSTRWIVMPSNIAMCYNDFTTNFKGEKDGVLVADRFRNMLYFRLYNTSIANQNFILVGPSGSGKSYTVGHFIIQRYNAKVRQVILDVGGTYKQIFAGLAGNYFEYNPENPISFNPFLVPYNQQHKKYILSSEKALFLKSLFEYLIKGTQKARFSPEEHSIYDKFIEDYYVHESKLRAASEAEGGKEDKREIPLPCLMNFSMWIQELYFETKEQKEYVLKWLLFKPENFVLILEPYVIGASKTLLNNKESLDISDMRLVCFDMAKIKDNQNLYPLVTMLLAELSFDMIRKYPDEIKVFLMDEAWSMLQEGMGEFVGYMFRTLRKNKGQMGIITQGILEIINSPVGKTLISNSETKIILKHTNQNEIQNLKAHMGLTDSEVSKIEHVKHADGARQFFVKQGENSAVYTLEVPLEESAVLTSQPDERSHLMRLKDLYMDNINNAIQQWVEDYKNNKIPRG